MNYTLEIQAMYARKCLDQKLEDVLNAAAKDKSLSPNILGQLEYLRWNEADQLTWITIKFRQQIQKSPYMHQEVERAIRLLEYSIRHFAMFFDVDTLFMCSF
ncbi:hypothetical protein A6770_28875 [Nostoc minutum NIES-26]|uniref:Uncharacterized protein n=1 Tax=Nostoc minutum NIES-26 TaxID=1844469 RepID=A0A367QKK8_9NOSO|nr:hypothetical protein A6770_28875 [Nostoc minutum NIES-26]